MPRPAPVALVCAVPAEARALRALAGPGRVVELGGIGAGPAAAAARRALDHGAAALISTGFCGARDPRLAVGDTVVATEVLDAATGTLHHCDPALTAGAEGLRVRVVTVSELGARAGPPGAGAVDMESAAIAAVAADAGVPFACVRAVTDTPGHRMPRVMHAVDDRGRLDVARLAAGLLRRPADIGALARLAIAARRAGAGLRRGLRPALEAI